MNLIDTGPLVALLDVGDFCHRLCMETIMRLPRSPFLTTWPCFTEAMYLLGAVGGYRYQANLWRWHTDKRLALHDLTATEAMAMHRLMEKYQDTPMDLADASMVIAAETRGIRRIFTLDSDFRVYRLADGSALEAIRDFRNAKRRFSEFNKAVAIHATVHRWPGYHRLLLAMKYPFPRKTLEAAVSFREGTIPYPLVSFERVYSYLEGTSEAGKETTFIYATFLSFLSFPNSETV